MLNAEPPPVNQRIQSIDRAVELLEAVASAPEPEPVADARGPLRAQPQHGSGGSWRRGSGITGFVERDAHGYRLGHAVLRLAAAAATSRSSGSPSRCCGSSPTRPARPSTSRSHGGSSSSTPTSSARAT